MPSDFFYLKKFGWTSSSNGHNEKFKKKKKIICFESWEVYVTFQQKMMCCVAQAKQFLELEAQHSAEDAAIKAALCYENHSSSDEEQLAQSSRPVNSLTRYFIL